MTLQSRIKNAKGQWLSTIPKTQLGKGTPYVSASLVASLKEAAALPKAAPELVNLSQTLSAMALRQGPNFMDPHTPESEAAWQAWCLTARPEAERQYHHRSYRSEASAKESYIQQRLDKGRLPFQPFTLMTWIYAPAPYAIGWTDDPGKAALFNGSEAHDLKAHCESLILIAKLLPKALKNAQALGVVIDPRAIPSHKLLAGVSLVAKAQTLSFEPETEYLNRSCFAIYVEDSRRKGFLTHKDRFQPDLGSARLFPTRADAESHGWRYSPFALVTVNIAPQSFERRGDAGDLRDLGAAITAKEAIELDQAIKNADIDRLRDEIKARELLNPTPAPAPAPARSSRL